MASKRNICKKCGADASAATREGDYFVCPRCGAVDPRLGMEDTMVSVKLTDLPKRPSEHDMFGRYRLLKRLSRDAFGETYLASPENADAELSLRQIHQERLGDATFSERFFQAAAAAQREVLPGVPRVLDFGLRDGAFYYVRERMEGRTLEEIFDEDGPIPFPLCLEAFNAVVSILSRAEARGMAHGGICPRAILLNRRSGTNTFYLLNMGLPLPVCAPLSEENWDSWEGALYAAPERCLEPLGPNIRSDIYSLGASIYHSLCGKLPYRRGEAPELLKNAVDAPPSLPPGFCPKAPAAFEKILSKCLEIAPGKRYPSMTELLGDLNAMPDLKKKEREPGAGLAAKRMTRRNLGEPVAIQTPTLAALESKQKDPAKYILWSIVGALFIIGIVIVVYLAATRTNELTANAAPTVARGGPNNPPPPLEPTKPVATLPTSIVDTAVAETPLAPVTPETAKTADAQRKTVPEKNVAAAKEEDSVVTTVDADSEIVPEPDAEDTAVSANEKVDSQNALQTAFSKAVNDWHQSVLIAPPDLKQKLLNATREKALKTMAKESEDDESDTGQNGESVAIDGPLSPTDVDEIAELIEADAYKSAAERCFTLSKDALEESARARLRKIGTALENLKSPERLLLDYFEKNEGKTMVLTVRNDTKEFKIRKVSDQEILVSEKNDNMVIGGRFNLDDLSESCVKTILRDEYPQIMAFLTAFKMYQKKQYSKAISNFRKVGAVADDFIAACETRRAIRTIEKCDPKYETFEKADPTTLKRAARVIDSKKFLPPPGARYFRGDFYLYREGPVSWAKARAFCEKMGGSLLTISDKDENAFATSLFPNDSDKNAWIGLKRAKHRDLSMSWINGEPVNYANWNSDYSNLRDAGALMPTGGWLDMSPKTELPFICVWRLKDR